MSEVPDYRGKNLRRRSFFGMDLDGADFTNADLRGADFTNASLVGAKLSNARLGVPPLAGAVLLAFAIVIAVSAGVLMGWAATNVRSRLSSGIGKGFLSVRHL